MFIKFVRIGRLHLVFTASLLLIIGILFALVTGVQIQPEKIFIGASISITSLLSVIYANDYFDLEGDSHNQHTPFSGGSGVLIKNPKLRKPAKWFAVSQTITSITLGAIFTILYGYPIAFFLFIIIANILGWFYAAPPVKLSYRGFSEITQLTVAGFMNPLFGYIITEPAIDFPFIAYAIAFTLYAFAFQISVEIPDLEADQFVHKKTLITTSGRKKSFTILAAVVSIVTIYLLNISVINPIIPQTDLQLIAIFSMLPLTSGLRSYLKRSEDRKTAISLASHNIATLTTFFLLANFYLFIKIVLH